MKRQRSQNDSDFYKKYLTAESQIQIENINKTILEIVIKAVIENGLPLWELNHFITNLMKAITSDILEKNNAKN